MLTLKSVEMNQLSQVELLAFQRVAITQLQALNLPVSHAIIAGRHGRSFLATSPRLPKQVLLGINFCVLLLGIAYST